MKKILSLSIIVCCLSCKSPVEKIEPAPSGLEVSNGTVERIPNFPSEFVPERNIDVWLPPAYSETKKYNVLYMHDGQMLYDAATTWNNQEWGVDEVMGQLIEEKAIEETIVVGIWNSGENRHAEYFPQKPYEQLSAEMRVGYERENEKKKGLFSNTVFSDAYLQFLVTELKPYIDENYATDPAKEATFIAGSSMGGLISWYAVTEYPDVFAGAAALSTHWPGNFATEDNPIPAEFLAYLDENLPAPGEHKFYFDYGTETLDAMYEPYQLQVDSLIRSRGYTAENWQTLKFEGADHSERSWNARLEIPLKFLLKK